ncbi:MAG: NAD-dependent epimerase/dehydratase family protein [Candidatus Aminicenantales bacterium]
MRVFITGASGFIGGHLARRFVRDGWSVRALVHRKDISLPGHIEVVPGDIRDFDLLKGALRGADVLFHLASALGASQIDRKEFFAINAEGTRTVLRAARAGGVRRIVHFSSAGVLGHVENNLAADENHPLDPRDVYDKSKLEGEMIAREAAKDGLNIVIVRPGWVYGPGDRRTFKLIRAAARRRLILVAKGKTLQSPVFIDDLIDGALLCLDKGRPGEIYNLAGNEVLTVKRMIETIAAAAGTKPPRISLPLAPAKAAAWAMGKVFSMIGKEAPLNPSRLAFFIHPKPLSIRKAAAELGYAPAWTFEKGMAATIVWYRADGRL